MTLAAKYGSALIAQAVLWAVLLPGCPGRVDTGDAGEAGAVERARRKIQELEERTRALREKEVELTVAWKFREKKVERLRDREEEFDRNIRLIVDQLKIEPLPAVVSVDAYRLTPERARGKLVRLHREREKIVRDRGRLEEKQEFYRKAAGQIGGNLSCMEQTLALLKERVGRIEALREEVEVSKALTEVNRTMAGMGEGELGSLARQVEETLDRMEAEAEAGRDREDVYPGAMELIAAETPEGEGAGADAGAILNRYGLD